MWHLTRPCSEATGLLPFEDLSRKNSGDVDTAHPRAHSHSLLLSLPLKSSKKSSLPIHPSQCRTPPTLTFVLPQATPWSHPARRLAPSLSITPLSPLSSTSSSVTQPTTTGSNGARPLAPFVTVWKPSSATTSALKEKALTTGGAAFTVRTPTSSSTATTSRSPVCASTSPSVGAHSSFLASTLVSST